MTLSLRREPEFSSRLADTETSPPHDWCTGGEFTHTLRMQGREQEPPALSEPLLSAP